MDRSRKAVIVVAVAVGVALVAGCENGPAQTAWEKGRRGVQGAMAPTMELSEPTGWPVGWTWQ